MLHRGGTVARVHGPLRAVLDAALSSPSRRGVLVDEDGALAGTVRADQVLTVIENTDRPDEAADDRYQRQDVS
jgi:osmoprotectant transport system ATP-binding protein